MSSGTGAATKRAIGTDIPWSIAWSGEDAFDLRPSREFPGLVDLVQIERPGQGMPNFGAMHISRQRRGMAGNLCHVCGGPTLPRDRWLFPLETGGFVKVADGTMRYASTAPPVHMACAQRARRLCPHLSRTEAKPVAMPAGESWLIPRPDVPPGMEAFARGLPAGRTIVFCAYRAFGIRFSRQVERWRADKRAQNPGL